MGAGDCTLGLYFADNIAVIILSFFLIEIKQDAL